LVIWTIHTKRWIMAFAMLFANVYFVVSGKQTVRISLLSNVVNVYRYTIYFKYNTNYSPIPNIQFSNKIYYLWTVNKFILLCLCKVISRVCLLTEKKWTNPIPAVPKWSNSSYIKREYIDVINHVRWKRNIVLYYASATVLIIYRHKHHIKI